MATDTQRDEPSVDRMRRWGRAHFERPAELLAAALVGATLVRRVAQEWRRAKLIEVEAYLGPRDLASHASKGRTRRTERLFGEPGRAYVYLVYGMHCLLNVVAREAGAAESVLLRAAEPLDGWNVDLLGPARLCKAFGVTLADNGAELTQDEFHIVSSEGHHPRIARRRRVGIEYAGHWAKRRLRFVDLKSPLTRRLRA